MLILFCLSYFMLVYICMIYPCIIFLLGFFISHPIEKKRFDRSITVLIIVLNEEKHIVNKIKNILAQDYPREKLELVLVSDGSTDNTVALVQPYLNERVRLIEFHERQGKAACFNKVIPLCNGEIILFADIRQRFENNAITELVANFADETVGAVSGELLFERSQKTLFGEGIDFYWRYEKFLRKNEARIDSSVGATGAIYAIRKSLFKSIPDDTLLDDVVIPMSIVSQGFRCVFEAQARVYDYLINTPGGEQARKIRTIAGNFQAFFRNPQWLNPFANRIFFQIFSHKFLRLFIPVFLMIIFISNIFLTQRNFILFVFMILQIFFYGFAVFGYLSFRGGLKIKIFSLPYAFVLLNVCTLKAALKIILFRPQDIWCKTDISALQTQEIFVREPFSSNAIVFTESGNGMRNAISVDLEDWFLVHNLSKVIKRIDWDTCELRLSESTARILNIFDQFNVKATFFVLGWIAEKLPELVREIERRGHEIASHGYAHSLLTHSNPYEFEKDLDQALNVLVRCGVSRPVAGFRAPSFTIVKKTMWAFPILEKYNIRYDSSIFPIDFHPVYGIVNSPLGPYYITEKIIEFPLTCVTILGKRFPCGGGYFRFFPYSYTKYCIQQSNAAKRPAVFYFHPWELDSGQPRLALPFIKRIRQYCNLQRTEAKLIRLLREFSFTTISDVLDINKKT